MIDTIEIRPTDVFAPDEAAKSFFPYRLANALHVTTRASFIQTAAALRAGRRPAPGSPRRDGAQPPRVRPLSKGLRARGRGARRRRDGGRVDAPPARVALEQGRRDDLLDRRRGIQPARDRPCSSASAARRRPTARRARCSTPTRTSSLRTSPSASTPRIFPTAAFFRLALGRPFYALEVAVGAREHRRTSRTSTRSSTPEARRPTVWKERAAQPARQGGRLMSRDPDAVVRLLGSVEWHDVRLKEGGRARRLPRTPPTAGFCSFRPASHAKVPTGSRGGWSTGSTATRTSTSRRAFGWSSGSRRASETFRARAGCSCLEAGARSCLQAGSRSRRSGIDTRLRAASRTPSSRRTPEGTF